MADWLESTVDKGTCSKDGCGRPVWARGRCNSHGYRDPEKLRAAKKRYYWKYRERNLARGKQWAKENPEKAYAAKRRHFEANREAAMARFLEWVKAHPEMTGERNRRYRAMKSGTAAVKLTNDLLASKWAYWGNRCWLCGGDARTWDHVKPLTKGGSHILANMRPACLACNVRKRNHWPFPTSPALARRHPLIARLG